MVNHLLAFHSSHIKHHMSQHMSTHFAVHISWCMASCWHETAGIHIDQAGRLISIDFHRRHQAERCRCGVLFDPFAGVGGNVVQFANTCDMVRTQSTLGAKGQCESGSLAEWGTAMLVDSRGLGGMRNDDCSHSSGRRATQLVIIVLVPQLGWYQIP